MNSINEDLAVFLKKGLDLPKFSNFSDDIVYHYTKLDSFIGMMNFNSEDISGNNRVLEFWPSHISTMNDPLDGAFFAELFLERVKRYFRERGEFEVLCFMNDFLGKEEFFSNYCVLKHRENNKHDSEDVRECIKLLGIIVDIDRRRYVINNLIDGYSPFIMSFSMRDSFEDHQDGKLPLWIPYADDARGVRLGFSVNKLRKIVKKYSKIDDSREKYNKHGIFYGGKDGNRILKVEYRKKMDIENIVDELFQKTVIFLQKINETASVEKELCLTEFCSTVSDAVMDYSMVLKPVDYEHEREVRVVLYQPDASRIPVRVGQRGVTPYIRFGIPQKNIKQILFGPAINSLSENFLKYRLGNDFKNIEIKKSGINYRS